jgi:hypothetical protein
LRRRLGGFMASDVSHDPNDRPAKRHGRLVAECAAELDAFLACLQPFVECVAAGLIRFENDLLA